MLAVLVGLVCGSVRSTVAASGELAGATAEEQGAVRLEPRGALEPGAETRYRGTQAHVVASRSTRLDEGTVEDTIRVELAKKRGFMGGLFNDKDKFRVITKRRSAPLDPTGFVVGALATFDPPATSQWDLGPTLCRIEAVHRGGALATYDVKIRHPKTAETLELTQVSAASLQEPDAVLWRVLDGLVPEEYRDGRSSGGAPRSLLLHAAIEAQLAEGSDGLYADYDAPHDGEVPLQPLCPGPMSLLLCLRSLANIDDILDEFAAFVMAVGDTVTRAGPGLAEIPAEEWDKVQTAFSRWFAGFITNDGSAHGNSRGKDPLSW